jgi:hypothetical protein
MMHERGVSKIRFTLAVRSFPLQSCILEFEVLLHGLKPFFIFNLSSREKAKNSMAELRPDDWGLYS